MEGFAGGDFEVVVANAMEGHVFGFLVDSFDLLPAEFAWREAVGWSMEVNRCEIKNPDPTNTTINCIVTHETAWSRAMDAGPYESEFPLRVLHEGDSTLRGTIERSTVSERAHAQFPQTVFVEEAWEPFLDWLEQNHPDDIQTMFGATTFTDIGLLPGQPLPAVTPESIELWQEHTASFVASVEQN